MISKQKTPVEQAIWGFRHHFMERQQTFHQRVSHVVNHDLTEP